MFCPPDPLRDDRVDVWGKIAAVERRLDAGELTGEEADERISEIVRKHYAASQVAPFLQTRYDARKGTSFPYPREWKTAWPRRV
jgi:hypothetical protein